MSNKKATKKLIAHEEAYVAFLKKRLDSENFNKNATPEEIQKTKLKYDKAKFKLKMLKEK
jgi:hypothetical protein